ncbi:MAG: CBS domain-containing protein [Cyclobacteriaceae bacterium]|jgi:acetoin utilization protein AcuB
MIAKDLINYMIPPLKPSDALSKAREWMEELRVTELPVADQGNFVGMVSEEEIIDADKAVITVEELGVISSEAQVAFDQHYYEMLKKAYTLGVRMIAVIDDKGQYTGVVSVEDVVEAFASSSSVQNPGAILVLSMEVRDYSLSEISKIIENNEASVLSSHMLPHPQESGKIQLTIKTNKEDITHIANNLEARGYRVSGSFSHKDEKEDDQERFESLMRFLST